MNPTQKYYEENADTFIQETLEKEMSLQYGLFEKHLHSDAHILDAGCGSGRDSLYFKNRSYKVTAFDRSQKMCDFAGRLLGQEVLKLSFETLDFKESFDAVWASASLLHVSRQEMPNVLERLSSALTSEGIVYASFKHGDKEFIKDERFFNSYTQESLQTLVSNSPFQIREILILPDTRPSKEDESWLNAVLAVDKS